MLLNQIPVLDKGFVAKLDSSGSSEVLNKVAVTYYKQLSGKHLTNISSLTLLVKCPLFVQLNLSLFNLTIQTLPVSTLETYLPNSAEIGASSLADANNISKDIERTSLALLSNQKAYTQDGADAFSSQVILPISTYTTILVHGMYNDWCKFVSQSNAPNAVYAYMDCVDQIIKAEWP